MRSETAPTATSTYWNTERVGLIGLPYPGVELKLVREGNQLSGEVRDYGNGFHAAVPFQPEGLFHSTKADGMGMGLALSHATVERLGGQLVMRALQPRGVLVSFRLPIESVVEGNE